MKILRELLTELRQLDELLGIYSNPNAFEPRGGHVETPRERELRLRFERSPRGQALIAASQRRDAAALKKLERLKKLGVAKPSRTPFPWTRNYAGWWHATNQWFTFTHSMAGYHTTQIITKSQRFSISDSEINQALDEYIKNLEPAYRKMEVSEIKRLIQDQRIDLCYPLQRRVYDKGWLKVYGRETRNGLITLEGTSRLAVKSAIREILAATTGEIRIQIDLYKPNSSYSVPTVKYLRNRDEAENYIIA